MHAAPGPPHETLQPTTPPPSLYLAPLELRLRSLTLAWQLLPASRSVAPHYTSAADADAPTIVVPSLSTPFSGRASEHFRPPSHRKAIPWPPRWLVMAPLDSGVYIRR